MTSPRAWRRGGTATCVGVLLLFVLSSGAEAQAPPPQPYSPGPYGQTPFAPPPARAEVQRDGILAGVSLGFGSINVSSESNASLDYELQFGGFLSNQWALAVEVWGASHEDQGYRLSNSNAGVIMQYWLSRTFWLKGGVGSASLEASIDDVPFETYEGATVTGGLGWDFYETGDFHFNLSFLMSIEGYEDTRNNVTASALQIGMQYY